MEEWKRCRTCGETKLASAFYHDRTTKDGHMGRCKVCNCRTVRAWYARNRERRREYDAARDRTARRRRQWKEGRARRRKERRAVGLAAHAVRMGYLKKPAVCGRCGRRVGRAKIRAHHANYDAPLRVRWLCQECHVEVHFKIRESARLWAEIAGLSRAG